MKFHDPLDSLLSSTSRVRVLRLLLQFPGTTFTGREVARLCAISPSQALTALDGLRLDGLAGRQAAGRAYLWSLVRTHTLFEPLEALFRADRHAMDSLRDLIRDRLRGVPVRRAVIFGSLARGDERPGSDIDLFVELRSNSRRGEVEIALGKLRSEILARFGNILSPLVYTRRESIRPPNPALLEAIDSEGLSVVG
ncbi:MAG: nucleotidyltransferase family protein [Candidatus Lutacidiplasmatales archaeon]